MRTWILAALLSLTPVLARAQQAAPTPQPAMPEISEAGGPPVDSQHPTPGEPFYTAWWFWTGIGMILAGVAIAIVVGVTTDDASDVGATVMMLRF